MTMWSCSAIETLAREAIAPRTLEQDQDDESEEDEFGGVLYALPEVLNSDASNSTDDGKCSTVAVLIMVLM